jgi:ABC-type branched-subunit amino acid transport system substrate-binding protein
MMPTPWVETIDIVDEFTGWTPQQFSDYYERNFGVQPRYQAVSAFAATLVLMSGINESQSFDANIIADSIRKRPYYETLYGNFSFVDNQVTLEMLVVQVQTDLTYSKVFPSVDTNGTLYYPMVSNVFIRFFNYIF